VPKQKEKNTGRALEGLWIAVLMAERLIRPEFEGVMMMMMIMYISCIIKCTLRKIPLIQSCHKTSPAARGAPTGNLQNIKTKYAD
jgi:hypothetical protein